ncbi:MBL fold metallo-hydrolase [Desulfomonile tiedjei]|uniref:Putative Zn-dependent hydrolase of beta-lactamase fold protein n=1 Tax=Desulfomonile tiedjei (strain ATCC 49306 / DSM 6799 / DCB-1) TaxID=706587 RepID=I4C5B3_DESTA|nr:MBL fold metallo-hydrolase [Desulfomonile tiedjei]AFM24754.1 putative Zn-dependent hydrolase of beta-lactamase fold protein [Desulfomonile tiedjei DSM 6799]
MKSIQFTYIGGPTALLEVNGLRLLTDPTFDPAGEEYVTSMYTLQKLASPAMLPESLGRIDVVLLSHDHHFDNLDCSGRAFLTRAKTVLTTRAGAERLGGNAVGLAPWQEIEIQAPNGKVLRVTGTPARHGPIDGDRGPVTGFVLTSADLPQSAIYVSGDTVWYEGVAEVGARFDVRIAILFMGAARVPEVGPEHLTMTADDGIKAAHAFGHAVIIPLHYEGWRHFSESRRQIEDAFRSAGIEHRLKWPEPGKITDI